MTARTDPESLRVKEIATRRKIKNLVHFTNVANLPSIARHGLLTRQSLVARKIEFVGGDHLRLDRCLGHNCMSVSTANYKLLHLYQNETNASYAMIVVSSALLWERTCIYCVENSATRDEVSRAMPFAGTAKGLQRIFAPTIKFSAEVRTRSRELGPEYAHYPTCFQAEALVPGDIQVDKLQYVLFDCEADLKACEQQLTPPDNVAFPSSCRLRVHKPAFTERVDYKHWYKGRSG